MTLFYAVPIGFVFVVLLALLYVVHQKRLGLIKVVNELNGNLHKSSEIITNQDYALAQLKGSRCGCHKFDFTHDVRERGRKGRGHIISEILIKRGGKQEPMYKVKVGAKHHKWVPEHMLEVGD